MKHHMQELTPTELEAVCGGADAEKGLMETILGGIGAFLDWLGGVIVQGAAKVKDLYEAIKQYELAV